MTVFTFLGLIWAHFVADFLLQTDKMALNKSSSVKWLGIHAGVYGLPFFLFGWRLALLTGFLHFLVDFVTSRVNKRLWQQDERHWFFVNIGIDQALHLTSLVLVYKGLGF